LSSNRKGDILTTFHCTPRSCAPFGIGLLTEMFTLVAVSGN